MSAEEAIAFDWDEGGEVERAETVLGTLETLLGRLDAHIDLVTRQDESVPHVTELVMQGSLAVVDMLYAGREDTCVDAIGYYQNSWEADLEPEPAPLDVWARGAVVAKPTAPQPLTMKPRSTISRPGSLASSLTDLPPAVEDDAQSRLTDKTATSKLSRQGARASQPATPKEDPPKPKLSPEDLEREDRLREEISIRRHQKQITQHLLATEEKARQDLAELQKSLKGKDYSYDHKGEVVIMAKIDPGRMPSLLTKPAAAVRDPSEEDADRPGSRGGAKGGKDSKKGVAAGRGKGGAAAAPEPTFIEKTNEAQPAPTETIKPATGVTLTTGRTTKKGGARKTGTLTDMSREEYTTWIRETGHFEELPESAQFQAEQQQKLATQREQFQKMQSARQESVSLRRADTLQAEQARRTASSGRRPSTESSDGGGPLGLGVASKGLPPWMEDAEPAPKAAPKREPRRADVNKLLTTASDWGNSAGKKREETDDDGGSLSPGKPPMRPTIELRERTVGKVPRRPRDRQYGYITERDLQEYQP